MGKSSSVSEWALYVDESGDFERADECVLVSGLVLGGVGDGDAFAQVRLKAALREAAPLSPWPVHRWLMTKPAVYPLWFELAGEVGGLDATIEQACRESLRVWAQKAPAVLEVARRRLGEGGEPSLAQLGALRAILSDEAPECLGALQAHADVYCVRIGQAIRMLSRESVSEESGPRALGFIAAEARAGDGIDGVAGERYFNLLVCLLGRVRDAAERWPGEHLIHVNLATRWAKHPDLPCTRSSGVRQPRQLALGRHHIEEACRRVLGGATGGAGKMEPLRVRFSTGQVWTYDAAAHPGIVVADSCANYLFGLLGGGRPMVGLESIDFIHATAQSYLGLPFATGEPRLSHVSAVGKLQRAVQQARESGPGELPDVCDGQLPAWSRQQAEAWMAYFGQNGGVM